MTRTTVATERPDVPAGQLLDPRIAFRLKVLVLLGAAAAAVALVLEPETALGNLLVAGHTVLGIALGAGLFLAIRILTRAGWCVTVERVPEALLRTLPLGLLLSAVPLAGLPWLYEWARAGAAADPLLAGKSWWLSAPFFVARAVLCLVLWLWLASRMLRARGERARMRAAALFVVTFAVTFSVAAFDWIMSLSPHWFSTIFAGYDFAGLFLSALAAITVIAVLLRRAGPLRGVVTDDHLHDLGRLVFGFSVFWAYLWFSQYLLIWYGNLPEETPWFVARTTGGWAVVFWLDLAVNFVVPFVVLMPRSAKRSEPVLLAVGTLLLAGRWLDVYLMVLPASRPDGPPFGPVEVLVGAAAFAALGLAFFGCFAARTPFPEDDPYFPESLHHHT